MKGQHAVKKPSITNNFSIPKMCSQSKLDLAKICSNACVFESLPRLDPEETDTAQLVSSG